MLAHAKIHARL